MDPSQSTSSTGNGESTEKNHIVTATITRPGEEKAPHIIEACKARDFQSLVDLATTKYGLVNDELRRQAWPLLLGCEDHTFEHSKPWKDLPKHKDEDQVRLDVDRSFVYYPNNESTKQIDRRKQELSDVITEVLRRYPNLCYFQGYHDIVQVALLVLGPEQAASGAARISLLRIRDFMLPSMTASVAHLRLLLPILYTADHELYQHIEGAQPYFALAATLTLYAHDITEYGDIARLFDFLLAREAVLSIYLYAAIILSRKIELLDTPPSEPEMQTFILSKLPQPLNLDALITRAVSLYNSHPPSSLPFRSWSAISSHSVLKTTSDPTSIHKQTNEECQEHFEKHAEQVRRQDQLEKALRNAKRMAWVYRRPAGAVGLAFAVGVLAWWLGKSGNGAALGRNPMLVFLGDWAWKTLGYRS